MYMQQVIELSLSVLLYLLEILYIQFYLITDNGLHFSVQNNTSDVTENNLALIFLQ